MLLESNNAMSTPEPINDYELDELLKELQGEDLDDVEYDFLTDDEVTAIENAESYYEVEQCDRLRMLCDNEPEIEG